MGVSVGRLVEALGIDIGKDIAGLSVEGALGYRVGASLGKLIGKLGSEVGALDKVGISVGALGLDVGDPVGSVLGAVGKEVGADDGSVGNKGGRFCGKSRRQCGWNCRYRGIW